MRVRLDKCTIVLCKEVFKGPESSLVTVTTLDKEQITIDCRSSLRANEVHNTLLFDGYFDAQFLTITDRRKLS